MCNMYEANRCPIDEYAEDFVGKQTSHENYENYKEYMRLTYEISKKSFEMKFTKCMTKYGVVSKREIHNDKKETFYAKVCLLTMPGHTS